MEDVKTKLHVFPHMGIVFADLSAYICIAHRFSAHGLESKALL